MKNWLPVSWWPRQSKFMQHFLHDDLQGRFFIELCGSTVLAEVGFDVDDVIPVLVVCNSEAHQAFLKEHMIQMILKRMADANHFMHNEVSRSAT